jgi:hypothetical protein
MIEIYYLFPEITKQIEKEIGLETLYFITQSCIFFLRHPKKTKS